MKFPIKRVLLILIIGISSCARTVDCHNCDDKLKAIWSYKLRLPFGMDLTEGEMITQNSDLSKIVILNEKTGIVKEQLSTTYDERGGKAVVWWVANKDFIIYEQVVDYKESYLKIYNRAQYKSSDSILIILKKDLSVTNGIVKMSGQPVVVDYKLLYILNDGTLNSYDLLNKRKTWVYKLNRLPASYSTIVTTKPYVHIQLPVSWGTGSEIITLSKSTGKLMWKKHFPGQLQLSVVNEKLLSIDKHGNLIYIDPSTGQFDSHPLTNQTVRYYKIIKDNLIALSTDDDVLIVKNIDSDKVLLRQKLCAELIEVNYSTKMNSLFLVDAAQHCMQINLKKNYAKCIQQFVDNYPNKPNFIMKGDSLYINKGNELRLIYLK